MKLMKHFLFFSFSVEMTRKLRSCRNYPFLWTNCNQLKQKPNTGLLFSLFTIWVVLGTT